MAWENSTILWIFYLHISSRKEVKLKDTVRLGSLYAILTKESGFGLQGTQLMRKRPGSIPGKLMEDAGYLVRSVSANSSQCDKNALPFLVWDGKGNTFTEGNMCSACKWLRGRQKTLPASTNSQLPLAQNNLYVGIFGGWHILDAFTGFRDMPTSRVMKLRYLLEHCHRV